MAESPNKHTRGRGVVEIKVTRHLWGISRPLEQALEKIAQSGLYDGIEANLPPEDEASQFRDLLDRHKFLYVAMAVISGDTVGEHLGSLREQLRRARKLGAKFCNCHSGRDDDVT